MVCPYCGLRVRWLRHYYKTLYEHDIDVYCKHCGKVVTLTSEDADREKELKMLPRHTKNERQGLCKMCGMRKPRPGLVTCDKCIQDPYKKKSSKEYAETEAEALGITPKVYNYRRSYGLCVVCGEPAKNSAKFCEKCKAEMKGKELHERKSGKGA